MYDLRHAAATTWLRAGLPLGEVARRLGHSVETLVSIYVAALQGDDLAAKELKWYPRRIADVIARCGGVLVCREAKGREDRIGRTQHAWVRAARDALEHRLDVAVVEWDVAWSQSVRVDRCGTTAPDPAGVLP